MEANIADVAGGDAQALCNFVILVPTAAPVGCHVHPRVQVRREEPLRLSGAIGSGLKQDAVSGVATWTTARPCSAIVKVTGEPSCAVRLKEYLPDWFPTGHTHLALCPPTGTYRAKAALEPCPRKSFEVEGRSGGCIGIDYAGKTCATLFLYGTMVEARVVEGYLEDDELIRMMRSLRPLVPGALVDQILSSPFAEACYWARYPLAEHMTFLGVTSLFDGFVWNFGLAAAAPPSWRPGGAHRLAGELLEPIVLPGYCVDSVCVIGGDDATDPVEILALYFPTPRVRDSYVWVRHIRKLGPGRHDVPWPPKTGAFPCELPAAKLEIDGNDVYTVHAEASCGAHDALFATPHLPVGWFTLVQASPKPGMHRDVFLGLVKVALTLIDKLSIQATACS
eukprot:gnl/TRDRNA2_/TRDRNA2_34721_c0_seq1.p1 gnl/TRDRNA2_/TRDRNA2_34721_c0~~gnl/TRDRNA2_/TRDRNA2_34721_c0_seq1.p1  ORF type:complete len:394 (-),score=57.76 gnl/TRDRNA2_/TRDRNA2_34721_c0_seq1:44-1225(-)